MAAGLAIGPGGVADTVTRLRHLRARSPTARERSLHADVAGRLGAFGAVGGRAGNAGLRTRRAVGDLTGVVGAGDARLAPFARAAAADLIGAARPTVGAIRIGAVDLPVAVVVLPVRATLRLGRARACSAGARVGTGRAGDPGAVLIARL